MKKFFPTLNREAAKCMVFVDGENLAIRYKNLLESKSEKPQSHIFYEENIYVWSVSLNNICSYNNVVRRHYYIPFW